MPFFVEAAAADVEAADDGSGDASRLGVMVLMSLLLLPLRLLLRRSVADADEEVADGGLGEASSDGVA